MIYFIEKRWKETERGEREGELEVPEVPIVFLCYVLIVENVCVCLCKKEIKSFWRSALSRSHQSVSSVTCSVYRNDLNHNDGSWMGRRLCM